MAPYESSQKIDPDRVLALSYVRGPIQRHLRALWQLDSKLGALLAGTREPMIAQMKLAWWREALETLGSGPVPAEPVLQAAAHDLLAAGLRGRDLARLAEGWEHLVEPDALSREDRLAFAYLRGGTLFDLSASVLLGECGEFDVMTAGQAWALVDLARRSSSEGEAAAALDDAGARLGTGRSPRWPVPLRPLGMLAVLAARDVRRGRANLEPAGAPARILRMLRCRLTGR